MIDLPHNTVCQPFEIRTPIWNGGKRVVGLNQQRIGDHNQINFSYVRKSDGEKSFPDTYYISGQAIKLGGYPTQTVNGGVVLVLVPFTDLQTMRRVRPKTEFITDPEKMPEAVRKVWFPEPLEQKDLFSAQAGQVEPKPVQLRSNSGDLPMKEE